MMVEVRWLENYRFLAEARGFKVEIDQRVEEGGEGRGFKPTELLLSAVASCFMTNLVKMLRFRGIKFSELRARAFTEGAKVVVEVTTDAGCEELFRAAEETCKISNMLKQVEFRLKAKQANNLID